MKSVLKFAAAALAHEEEAEAAGGYAGAAVSRLTASLAAWSGSVNAELDNALPILRARGRQLAANSEHGKRFLSLVATNVVGRSGPTLQVRAYNDQRNPAATPTLDAAANAAVEAAIALAPEQFLWSYNRYKAHAGAGEPA